MKLLIIATVLTLTTITAASAADLTALNDQCLNEGGEFFAAIYRLNPSGEGVQKKLIFPEGVERPPRGVNLAFLPVGEMQEGTIYQTWRCQMAPPKDFTWD